MVPSIFFFNYNEEDDNAPIYDEASQLYSNLVMGEAGVCVILLIPVLLFL